ncbi:MAG: hypothetical protein ACI9QD_000194 [Thermoproteota archaeon]|jgi:uncharacterized protein YdiU (UPF0061 family)
MINFNNTYIKLPENFYSKTMPEKFLKPELIAYNKELAQGVLNINLDDKSDQELAQIFAGQIIPKKATPIALAYAGHQFGHFNPQLGDGRAVLLGEVIGSDKKRYDIQLKGSGRTPYSRNGDGLSSLGPVIREYIVSEAMFYLGVPTTRALAAVTTGESVYREEELPGGVLTRVASSHIRVGTFEFFAARDDQKSLKVLTEYCIDRHYPEVIKNENMYLEFVKAVAQKQAGLIAKWMSLGFIHGVMNTDNMTISGETIDFGPCAFMDTYSADKVFSSIDRRGRYAYKNQIDIAKWNLFRLASCLLALIDPDPDKAQEKAQNSLQGIIKIYEELWLVEMSKKFGIFNPNDSDILLIKEWLNLLEENKKDFTLSFRDLSSETNPLRVHSSFEYFFKKLDIRLSSQDQSLSEAQELMDSVNPFFIPRNHQVERAIQGALKSDYSIFHEMNKVLKSPYKQILEFEEYRETPTENERVKATFCGT